MEEPGMNRDARLAALAETIKSHRDWWQFPGEIPTGIRGFRGANPVFFVGDQPSTSPWEENHPSRRTFYDLLARLGHSEDHLTDLYKRRGRASALKDGLPADFEFHVEFFREELEIVQPARVVALGKLTHKLLLTHVPELKPILRRVWHFAYAARPGKSAHWEVQVRRALDMDLDPGMPGLPPTQAHTPRPVLPVTNIRPKQTDLMRRLWEQFKPDKKRVVREYADAEDRGEVTRSSNKANKPARAYARDLLYDGLHKGWLR